MNKIAINIIGKKQTAREDALLFMVNEVEGLMETLDKDFSEWSDFDCWENMGAQQWIFSRALDLYHHKKIDIKCECCEIIDLNQIEIKNISNQKCCGIKSAYIIENIVDEIVLAKERREIDGTYSA
mgnify:CR=1 FL=1